MKTLALLQLGGGALVLSTIVFAITNVMYFLGGEQALTTPGLWLGMFGCSLRVLGVVALFARQAQRGGVLGLVGFVLLVWGNMGAFGAYAVQLGVTAGVVSSQELAQVYAQANTILISFLVVGEIVMGISMYRAQVFPKYMGALLVLVGVLHLATGYVAFTQPIYAICAFVGYLLPGWILATDKRAVGELVAATL